MLRSVTLLIWLMIYATGNAQEPLNHPKKIYKSPEGLLYVQKGEPVYLWLSDSPGESAKKYRLFSTESAQYSNPMYFDTDGYNTLRSPSAVDTSTRKQVLPLRDIIFDVYADASAPVTRIDYGDTKVVNFKGKIHLGGNTSITLTSKDELSGLENIYYSIDGAPFKPYTAAITFSTEKEYVLKYYAVDNVGNVEKIAEYTLVYDKTTPTTKLEIEGDKFEDVISARSKFILNTTDQGTGIAKILYSLDSGVVKTYTAPITMALLSQGEHNLTYYSSDKVGNNEPPQSYTFYVDKTPPTIIEEVIGKTFFSNGKEFSSGKSQLKLTSFDNKAGVKEVNYSVNEGEYKHYDKPVFLTQTSGSLLVKTYAVDNVNNRSNSQTANDKTSIPYIDLTGPTMNHIFTGPEFKTRDTVFVNNTTKIVIKSSDAEAGMNRIEYSLDGVAVGEYSESFTVNAPGYHTLDYTGFDNVENTSSKTFSFFVDNTGPKILYTFGTSILHEETGVSVYPSHTVIFLAASDEVVGYQRMTYSINNGSETEYLGIIKGLSKGKNELKVKAFDKLGNTSEISIGFIIE